MSFVAEVGAQYSPTWMPSAAGSPQCTGAPCAKTCEAVTSWAVATRSGGMGRMLTTMRAEKGGTGSQSRLVLRRVIV